LIRIIDSRATGKTGRLMLLAKETNGVIVCKDPITYKDKALRYGLVGIDFVAYHEYIDNLHKFSGRNIYIDELSMFLTAFSGEQIKGFTESID
jgi:hypothetical protein